MANHLDPSLTAFPIGFDSYYTVAEHEAQFNASLQARQCPEQLSPADCPGAKIDPSQTKVNCSITYHSHSLLDGLQAKKPRTGLQFVDQSPMIETAFTNDASLHTLSYLLSNRTGCDLDPFKLPTKSSFAPYQELWERAIRVSNDGESVVAEIVSGFILLCSYFLCSYFLCSYSLCSLIVSGFPWAQISLAIRMQTPSKKTTHLVLELETNSKLLKETLKLAKSL
jgi:hypothetical protein